MIHVSNTARSILRSDNPSINVPIIIKCKMKRKEKKEIRNGVIIFTF